MRIPLCADRILPRSGVPLWVAEHKVGCACGYTGRLLQPKPWPGARLWIGDCRQCGTTSAIQPEDRCYT
jgi:hypothetical protein